MKNKFTVLCLILLGAVLLNSCKKDDPEPVITLPADILDAGLTVSVSGGEQTVAFFASQPWTAEISTSKADGGSWLSVTPPNGPAGDATLTVTAEPNTTPDDREAAITISIGGMKQTFSVKQRQRDALILSDTRIEVGYAGGEFEVELEANVEVSVEIPEEYAGWLSRVPEESKALTSSVLKFKAQANTSTKSRTGKIVLKNETAVLSDTVYVVQADAADAVIPDDKAPEIVRSKSFFVINEDWFGHQNGTVNRFWLDGTITYRAYRKANPGWELGVTTQFAINYGGNLYFMSKQGQRFVVADAQTLQKKASFKYIGDENGGDGRACVGVDAETVYVGTSSGIHVFDIPSLSFTGKVAGVDGGADLYTGQTGDMVRIGHRVFAVMQGKGILVIDTRTHSVETTLEPSTTGGVCQSKNGWLWISGNPLKAYDPYTLELKKTVAIPAGDGGGGAGWGAWRSCSLCAATQENAIYWMGRDTEAWTDGDGIFKYDIDNDQLNNLFGFSSYGMVRIEPLSGYITSVGGSMYDDQGNRHRKYTVLGGTPNEDGTIDDENSAYMWWFPTLPVFEDVNRPAILTNQIVLAPGEEKKLCLSDMVIDHDNISKSILKEIVFESNDVVESEISQDTLYLKALDKTGQTGFTFKANSNGFPAEKYIRVDVR